MNYNILLTDDFKRKSKRLSKKYKSLKYDLENFSKELQINPTITPLGKNCYKVRMSISSKSSGKSGGARVITCVIFKDIEVYLLTIYDKSEQDSITDKELEKLVSQIKSK